MPEYNSIQAYTIKYPYIYLRITMQKAEIASSFRLLRF